MADNEGDRHEPSYAEKLRDLWAFYERVGYDPEAHRAESRIKDLENQIRKLQSQNSDLEEKVRLLEQRLNTELAYISRNIAEYAEQAVFHALKKKEKHDARNQGTTFRY